MNLRFANLTKEGPKGVTIGKDETHVTFNCVKPVTVQPSEIQRIKIGIACEIPFGHVLQISTYPQLADKAVELFPALTVIDSTYRGELVLAIRNHGRNPFNFMIGYPAAIGHLIKIEQLEIEDFEYEAPTSEARQSRPQKKNPISFEVK